MKKSIPTEFDIAARSNIGSVLFDSVKQPILTESPNIPMVRGLEAAMKV